RPTSTCTTTATRSGVRPRGSLSRATTATLGETLAGAGRTALPPTATPEEEEEPSLSTPSSTGPGGRASREEEEEREEGRRRRRRTSRRSRTCGTRARNSCGDSTAIAISP